MSRIIRELPNEVSLVPGGHLVVLSRDPLVGIGLRRLGLEIRDTLLVLGVDQTQLAFLVRKPPEGTLAENVLRYGEGGLWIDGCRVGVSGGTRRDGKADRPNDAGWANMRGHGIAELNAGRWPTNLVLIHGPECRQSGTRKVKAITGTLNGSWRTGHQYSGGYAGADADQLGTPIGYGDEDGNETIPAWECQEGCPVKALDQQSGYLHGSGNKSSTSNEPGNLYEASSYHISYKGQANRDYGSAGGGASRFFPQFADTKEFEGWLTRLLGGGR